MQTEYTRLLEIINEIYDLSTAQGLLGWDQLTYMPPMGAEGRGHQLSILAKLIHERSTSQELGDLLSALKPYAEGNDPDSDEACLIRVTSEEYDKAKKIDPAWIEESEQVKSEGNIAWQKARQEADFSIFSPWLEKRVALTRAYAGFFAPFDHIYDPLIDEYEPGLNTRDLQSIFNTLRPQQVELIHAISERQPPKDDFLYQEYPVEDQRAFSIELLKVLGYDFQRGRLDVTAHPFTSTFGLDDVRVTTRFETNFPGMAMFATMHECGHALYEMGVSRKLMRTALASGTSSAFHESQSRLYENLIGRSLSFWKYAYPKLQSQFPKQLGGVSLDSFFKAINRVKPSFIRVEADEATYNLHIMLRMELEIALLEGSIEVSDLPEAWNERMQDYLGITPENDAIGVLQDIHWSIGLFGYFPTYALGNLVSVQIWERMKEDLPDIDAQIEKGQLEAVLDWLVNNIHQHGRKYKPQELMMRVTGSKIDPAPYMRYLKQKYGALYAL